MLSGCEGRLVAALAPERNAIAFAVDWRRWLRRRVAGHQVAPSSIVHLQRSDHYCQKSMNVISHS